MAESDLPRYFPSESDLSSFGQVILRELPDNTPISAVEQPFRDRTLFLAPDKIPVRVSFWKPRSTGSSQEPSANLKDLALQDTGVTQERLAEVLIEGGLNPVLPPESDHSVRAITPEQAFQDASTTWTGHALREKGLLPEPGVMQARRGMPEPHASRRPANTRRWS